MKNQQKTIDDLIAKCHVYKIERLTLLRVIKELSDLLYEKFQGQQDRQADGDGDDIAL